MSSWFSEIASSHRLQLGVTAIASACLAAGAVISLQEARKWYNEHELKESIPGLDQPHDIERISEFGGAVPEDAPEPTEAERSAALARRARLGDYDEGLILEQLARNRVFLTDDGLAKLRRAFVIVVGCGGVGSHAAAALARSGCGRLRLIDFDQVTLSSLNRHSVATLADVGTSKVYCLQRRLEQITPWTSFDCRNELFSEASAEVQLEAWKDGQKPDFVIDAIDNIDSKVALLHYCHTHSIPVVSSMGAGCKSDPTRIFIGDISSSTEDPLSRSTRRRLRALGVASGIPVVYSTEKPGPGKAQLLPLPEEEFQKGSVGELGVLPDFRVRILPVLGTMPAIFGYAVANHVILQVTGYPHEYVPAKGREKMYDGILAQLQSSEEKLVRATVPGEDAQGLKLPVSVTDVGYVVEEVYKGKSAISGIPTRLALVRWRRPEMSVLDTTFEGQKGSTVTLRELVCMTKEEAARHEREVVRGSKAPEDLYDKETVQYVEERMKEEQAFEKYR